MVTKNQTFCFHTFNKFLKLQIYQNFKILKNRGAEHDAVRKCHGLNATVYLPTDEEFIGRTMRYHVGLQLCPQP